ncbi:unnamed protein product [Diatraea saccharalis]|uniref:Uncharacterized protein n=1 Tax=Diatraea saccharalis TaxID=40085 RepID=A0A9N9WAP4_9NEOP|nr:unnamed protein product [Diatraea saccharalis]
MASNGDAYAFNGGPPSAIGNAVIKSTAPIGNRGVFVEKLPLNRGTKDRFQSRLVVNRPNYNYYSSGFLERARLLERERIRAGLAHVEILMNNPNEYGYVMLDDRALNVLASLIDKILPKDINLH